MLLVYRLCRAGGCMLRSLLSPVGGLVTRLSLGPKDTRGVTVALFVLPLVSCVALNELEALDGGFDLR